MQPDPSSKQYDDHMTAAQRLRTLEIQEPSLAVDVLFIVGVGVVFGVVLYYGCALSAMLIGWGW